MLRIVKDLSSDVGRNVSRREREETFQTDASLRYGELGFKAVASILKKLREDFELRQDGVCLDLGSGMGKAVIAAALAHKFRKSVGVETLEGLHVLSLELASRYEGEVELEMVRGDLLKADDLCKEADVIFVHGACFTDKLWVRVAQLLAACVTQMCFVVTVSLQLPAADFDQLDAVVETLDGGLDGLLFVYRRKRRSSPSYYD